MAVKIAVTREYEDEKRRSLKQVTFVFFQKKLTALSDIFFLTFGGYAPDW